MLEAPISTATATAATPVSFMPTRIMPTLWECVDSLVTAKLKHTSNATHAIGS